jgi:hypothetical protein
MSILHGKKIWHIFWMNRGRACGEYSRRIPHIPSPLLPLSLSLTRGYLNHLL